MTAHLFAWFLRFLGMLGRVLPRPLAYRAADGLGALVYGAVPARRRVALRNMRLALGPEAPEGEVRRRARQVFGSFYRNHVELGIARGKTAEGIAGMVLFEGLEHIDTARRAGRGVILLTCHLGNWELGGMAFATHFPTRVVVWRLAAPVERLFAGARERAGFRPVYLDDRKMPRHILRALGDGEVVVLMADSGAPTGDGVTGELFGAPWTFPEGPLYFAEKTGAALVPGFILRDDFGQVHGFIEEEIPLERTGGGKLDSRAFWERFASRAEHHIRRRPEQWAWIVPGQDSDG